MSVGANLTYDRVWLAPYAKPIFLQDALTAYGVSLEAFGAKGDGATADDAAFAAAVATGKPIIGGGPDKIYRLNNANIVSNRDFIFFGNGCTILQGANVVPLTIKYDFTDIQSISSISNGVSYTFPLGSGTTTVSTANVSAGSAFPAGSILKVYSDDLNSGPNPANLERKGEFIMSGDVVSNTVYFLGQLRDTYTTTPRIAKMSTYRLIMSDVWFDYNSSATSAWSASQLVIMGAYSYQLTNVKSKRGQAAFCETYGCYQGRTENLTSKNLRTSASDFAYGYNLVEYSCEGATHIGLGGDNVRHAYTTGTRSTTTNDTRVERYGRTRDTLIIGGDAGFCSAAAWDTHPDGENVTFFACKSRQGWRGSDSNQGGFNLRGISNKMVCCSVYGGQGLSIDNDYADPDNSRDHYVFDFYHETYSVGAGNSALNIRGQSGGGIDGVVIDGITVRQEFGTGNFLMNFDFATNVRVRVNSIVARHNTGGRTVEVSDGSSVYFKGGDVDYTNCAGTDFRTSLISDSTSLFDWENPNFIRGSASWQALANFNSANGTARFWNVRYDTAYSDADGKVNGGGSETFSVSIFGAGGSGISDGDKGDITVSGGGATWTIDSGAVTYAKMQNTSSASVLLGRGSSGSGSPQEITLGSGLSMTGTTISSSAALTISSATLTLGNGAGVYSHSQIITDAGVSPTDKIVVSLAAALDSDENSPEMLSLDTLTATAGSGNLTVLACFSEKTSGNVKINYLRG